MVASEHAVEMSDDETVAPDDYVTVLKEMKYSERMKLVGPTAKPLADKSLKKKIGKLIKKAKAEKMVACGVKDCVKQIYKKQNEGIVVFAGDVSPIDTITHVHGICYSKCIPYCYVPTRYDLGSSFAVNINACCLCIRPNSSYRAQYDEVVNLIKELEQ